MIQTELFSEVLAPPQPGMVLRICRWPEVFENAKSLGDRRKQGHAGKGYKALSWFSCPTSFNSTGYQKTLDRFDPYDAAALYGCWQGLCQLAAQSNPLRGRLCGEKGEPYNVRRIARMTGFSAELYEKLLPWCLEINWLEWAFPLDPYPGFEHTQICPEHPDFNPSPDDRSVIAQRSPDDRSVVAQNDTPDQTRPDLTRPHPTPRAKAGEESFQIESQSSKPEPSENAERPVVATPNAAEASQSDDSEDPTEWPDVLLLLQQAGVQAASRCVSTAKNNRWTLQHAVEVLKFAKLKRFAGREVYERFQLAAKVAASDGWIGAAKPAPKSQHLEQQTEAERRRRAEHGRVCEADKDVSFAAEAKQKVRANLAEIQSAKIRMKGQPS